LEQGICDFADALFLYFWRKIYLQIFCGLSENSIFSKNEIKSVKFLDHFKKNINFASDMHVSFMKVKFYTPEVTQHQCCVESCPAKVVADVV